MDSVCKGFEDYAQATSKAGGEPTLIRLMTHQGNMNPRWLENYDTIGCFYHLRRSASVGWKILLKYYVI